MTESSFAYGVIINVFCVQALADLSPRLQPLLEGCKDNRRQWEKLANDHKAKEQVRFKKQNFEPQKTLSKICVNSTIIFRVIRTDLKFTTNVVVTL